MTEWVRLWHDMPTDPKWRVIARKSGQSLPCVIAVFNLMMVNASGNAAERGCLCAWNDEDAAAALDMDPEEVAAIRQAMQGKVLEGSHLTGWEKRQPKREDGTAAKRKAEWKERKEAARNTSERAGTQGNAPETDAETETELDSPGGESPSGDEPALRPEHVFEGYQKLAETIGRPVPRDFTPERRQLVKGRMSQYSLEDFQTVFAKCRDSPFLRGDKNDGRTPLTFDWLMKKSNFQKVLEGNYDV